MLLQREHVRDADRQFYVELDAVLDQITSMTSTSDLASEATKR